MIPHPPAAAPRSQVVPGRRPCLDCSSPMSPCGLPLISLSPLKSYLLVIIVTPSTQRPPRTYLQCHHHGLRAILGLPLGCPLPGPIAGLGRVRFDSRSPSRGQSIGGEYFALSYPQTQLAEDPEAPQGPRAGILPKSGISPWPPHQTPTER